MLSPESCATSETWRGAAAARETENVDEVLKTLLPQPEAVGVIP